MAMKAHSYMSVNCYLERKYRRSVFLQDCLDKNQLPDEVPGRSEADKIAAAKEELEIHALELKNDQVVFPNNISLWNWIDFLLVPTLVYELSYPRIERYFSLLFQCMSSWLIVW